MAKDIYYTAVDIGTNKVCAILARVGSEGELKVLGTGIAPSQGVQKGRIESIDEVKAAVAAALADRIHKNFFKSVPFVERPRKEAHNAAA